MIVGGTDFIYNLYCSDIDFNKDPSTIVNFNKNDIANQTNILSPNYIDNEENNCNIDNKFECKTTINEEYRESLYNIAQNQGNAVLHHMLAEVDKESAKNIHPNNVKRVIRALEYYKETGNKISTHNETQRQKVSPYNFAYFVLNDDRKKLYEKIDTRVEIMFQKGL